MQDLKLAKAAARLAAVALVLAGTRAAVASDRLAVLVVVAGDPELSDNLTEVAISKLAQRRDRHLVGLREVRESLGDLLDKPGIGACLEQPSCLSRLGVAAQADSALIGDVRREAGSFAVRLALVDTRTGVRAAESAVTVPADMKQLIAAVRTGVAALFEAKAATVAPGAAGQPEPATVRPSPKPSPTLDPRGDGSPPPPSLFAREEEQRRQPRWHWGVGYGAGGAAVIALSAAAVTGSLATATPAGASRAEMAADLERREDYATVANTLFIVGGALALVAIATFVWLSRRD